MMDLDDLRVFVEVVEAGGINKAAQRLGLAKSVVSRRTARIEADLGTPLITRSPRGIGTTDAAREFAERGRRILSEVAEARKAVAAHSAGIAGSFRIALPLSFGIRRMAPVLASLHAAYPHLEIDASYSDTSVDLLAGRFDAAVRIGNLKPSTLVARRIAAVSLILVASPEYLQRGGALAGPPDLTEHECLIYSGQPERPAWRFGGARGAMTISPRGHFHFDNGEGLLHAAEAGLGIAALPDFTVSDSLKSGRLISLLKDHPLEGGVLHVVRPPASMVSPKVRTLTHLMVARFSGRTSAELPAPA